MTNVSDDAPIQAHSKTEYKRMVAQGANVLPPGEREAEERKVCGVQRPEQEPVAWIHNFIEGGISIGKRPSDLDRHSDRWTALFKNPKPCPTCEALSRTVMLDQTSHDAATPQRTWVGLTGVEVNHIFAANVGYPERMMKEVEALLKDKNT